MSIILKPGQIKVKDNTGQYTGINIMAQESTQDYLDQIEEKGEETIASIPADYTALSEEVTQLNERFDSEGLSEDAKVALLNCFAHVHWIDEHGQDYYDALEDVIYPYTGLVRIDAVFTQGSDVIYPSTPLNDLKAYLVVTGYYNDGTSKTITDYALFGTLEVGTSTITVAREGKTDTFSVTVSEVITWDYEWDVSSGVAPVDKNGNNYPGSISDGLFILSRTQNPYFLPVANNGAINVEIEFNLLYVAAGDWYPVFNFALSSTDGFYFGRTGTNKIRSDISGAYVSDLGTFPQTGALHKLIATVSSSGCSYEIDDTIETGPGSTNRDATVWNTTGIQIISSNEDKLGIKSIKYRYLDA